MEILTWHSLLHGHEDGVHPSCNLLYRADIEIIKVTAACMGTRGCSARVDLLVTNTFTKLACLDLIGSDSETLYITDIADTNHPCCQV